MLQLGFSEGIPWWPSGQECVLSLPRALLGELRFHKPQGAARKKKRFLWSPEFSAFSQIQKTLFPQNDSSWWIAKVRSKETVSRYVPNPEDLMAYNYMILDTDTQKGRYILLLKFKILIYLLLMKQEDDYGHVECGYK